MDDEGFPIIVCVRACAIDRPVSGSVTKLCKRCLIPVWVGPSSLQVIHDEGAEVCCERCATVLSAEEGWLPGEILPADREKLLSQGLTAEEISDIQTLLDIELREGLDTDGS